MKTTTVPVIIGALGLVKKGTENYIGKIPGDIRITGYRRPSKIIIVIIIIIILKSELYEK